MCDTQDKTPDRTQDKTQVKTQDKKRKHVSFDSPNKAKQESVTRDTYTDENTINTANNAGTRKRVRVHSPPIIQNNTNCTFHESVTNGMDNNVTITNITNNYNCKQYTLNNKNSL
jgi:hypothetical protein